MRLPPIFQLKLRKCLNPNPSLTDLDQEYLILIIGLELAKRFIFLLNMAK